MSVLTIYVLFSIGLKGSVPLAAQGGDSSFGFLLLLAILVFWGLLQPFLSYSLLRKFTGLDNGTLAAISASFGSVSVMTFIAATSFLEQIEVPYQSIIITALAIMEIPAIISGLFLAKIFGEGGRSFFRVIFDSIFNKSILAIVAGLCFGFLFKSSGVILFCFKPALSLFLFLMGIKVGLQRENFRSFSLSLSLFGIYMPLIGGFFGLFLSFFLGLDVGSGTLVAVLAASASYIAVPAAMRIALPLAKEAIYLPLSLGLAFPFNLIVGIPLYYYFANWFL